MKKFSFLSLLLGILVISCRPNPEEQVKEFAVKFGDFVNTNQKDSVQKHYTGFESSDSLAKVTLGNIIVKPEDKEGIYKVEYSQDISVTVKNEKGDIQVVESKGLLEYPENRINLAKQTGMWDDNLTDIEMAQRMKDEEYFNFISKKTNFNPDKILTVGKFIETGNEFGFQVTYGYYTITNNTD